MADQQKHQEGQEKQDKPNPGEQPQQVPSEEKEVSPVNQQASEEENTSPPIEGVPQEESGKSDAIVLEQEKTVEESKSEPVKKLFKITARELMAIEGTAQRYLLEPFLPAAGTALIAGMPDTGKSQLARQLATMVAHGMGEFLGYKLHLKHSKAIYVATEDDAANSQTLVQKQHQGLDLVPNDNLGFVFASDMPTKDLLHKLDSLLQQEPVDIIVVDSFGDIFNGSDLNSNLQMRESVKPFDGLAKKYGCTILFVHHINKAGYGKNPSQQHIQGGGGLTQKVRFAWQLDKRPDGNRVLSVVKGNYTPDEFKRLSQVLSFNTATFTFTLTGETMQTNQLESEQVKLTEYQQKLKGLLPELEAYFKGKLSVRYNELVKFMATTFIMSESTAKRDIKALTEDGYLISEKSGYSWNSAKSEPESEVDDPELEDPYPVDEDEEASEA